MVGGWPQLNARTGLNPRVTNARRGVDCNQLRARRDSMGAFAPRAHTRGCQVVSVLLHCVRTLRRDALDGRRRRRGDVGGWCVRGGCARCGAGTAASRGRRESAPGRGSDRAGGDLSHGAQLGQRHPQARVSHEGGHCARRGACARGHGSCRPIEPGSADAVRLSRPAVRDAALLRRRKSGYDCARA